METTSARTAPASGEGLPPAPAPPAPGPTTPSARKLALLLCHYFVQGMPFGFQVTALPLLLAVRGVPVKAFGFIGLLAAPWVAKALWAPLVDRYGSIRYGRRRSWIVPAQAALAVSCAAAAFVARDGGLPLLLALVLLMNLFAATQDIAVDGLAVDLLGGKELGPGNAVQVVGYKLGMLTSGGLLVWASGYVGWPGLFAAMALFTWIVLVVTLNYREPPPSEPPGARPERRQLPELLGQVMRTARLPGTPWLLAFVASYKIGETMVDVMFKPYLVAAGFRPADIGLWLGTYGMVFSLAGSVAGGWLAARMQLVRAVGLTAALRVLPLAGIWLLSFQAQPSKAVVIAASCAEHFFSGTVTTAMFAFMMSRVDRRIGATHYTLLASVEVAGKSLGAWPSGFIAHAFGYGAVFLIGTLLSLVYLALLWPRLARGRPEVATAQPSG